MLFQIRSKTELIKLGNDAYKFRKSSFHQTWKDPLPEKEDQLRTSGFEGREVGDFR